MPALSHVSHWDSGTNTRRLLELPTAADVGTAHALIKTAAGEWEFAEVELKNPPLDTFIAGWQEFPILRLEDILTTGVTVHAAVNVGPQTPTIAGVNFEQSAANTTDTNIPNNGTGWSGTNWNILRANQGPLVPTIGSNTARLEVTADPDLEDGTYGLIAGGADFLDSSVRRNTYIEFSNLTVGNQYYACLVFGTYMGTNTNSLLTPTDGGDPLAYGVSVDSVSSKAIKRYGFTATGTTFGITKQSYDGSGAYMNGAFCLEVV